VLSHMAIPMTSFAGVLANLEDDRARIVSDRPFPDERRSKIRYPLDLNVRFRFLSGLSGFSGVGHTINLSSSGILVFSKHIALHEISAGAGLKMTIEWPFLLDDRIPLQLFAVGRMLRRGSSTFAATFDRHQFRTMSVSRQPPADMGGNVIEWRPDAVKGD
jgi:hypothetical protein